MLHYPQAIVEGARIGHGGAGGDDVKVVAHHVGHDEPEHGGREGRAHEAASAEAGKVFAQRIDLMDCRSTFQQHTGKPLHVGQRDFRMQGRGKRAGPARKRAQDKVVLAAVQGHVHDFARSRRARLIGDRVPAFLDPDVSGPLSFRQIVPVFDDHESVADTVAEQVFQRSRHRCRALARAEHADTAVGVEAARPRGGSGFVDQGQFASIKVKVAQYGPVGCYGAQGRVREAAQFGGCLAGGQIGHGAAPVVLVGEGRRHWGGQQSRFGKSVKVACWERAFLRAGQGDVRNALGSVSFSFGSGRGSCQRVNVSGILFVPLNINRTSIGAVP